jgi:CubicO group peptidase (beta-lactamase class C family)
MRKFAVIVAAIFLLAFSAAAQEIKLPVFVTDSLDQYIQRGMRDWQIPGLAIAIVKNGKVVFMKGYGVKKAGKIDPVNEETLFMIGSNTKAFTATALAMLDHQKALSLDDKVTRWIPDFRLADPLASREVTVRDLLCHHIGFGTFQGDFTYWTSSLTRGQVIQKMSLIKAPYSFRTKWGYCNAAFVAAGEVVPAVTSKSWEDFVREKILMPLNMKRTLMLSKDLSVTKNAAASHTIYKGKLITLPYPMIDNLAPAGSMSSNVREMSNWLIAQLDLGKFEGKQVIPSEAINKTREPGSYMGVDQRENPETNFYLYGLGFELRDRKGKLIVSHTGGVDGFVSSLVMIPSEKMGVIVLTNNDQNIFFQLLTNEIRDSFLDMPYRGYQRGLNNFIIAQQKDRHWLDSLQRLVAKKNIWVTDIKNFTGTYSNEVYGDLQIKQEASGLVINFSNHPGMVGKLEYLQDSTFLCTYSNPTMGIKEIPFRIEQGKVTGLTLRVADFVEFTPYEFVRKP